MGCRGLSTLLFSGIALGCIFTLPARGQSGDGQKPASPPAQQGTGGATGGNSFPNDTANVPVMPIKESPNPPSAPGAGAAPSAGPGAGQTPAQGSGAGPGSDTGAPGSSNQFPEDTSNVPVMPSKGTPALPEGTYSGDNVAANVGLPNDDADPVKSPDDPAAEAPAENQGFSSSNTPGLDKILERADEKAADADQQMGKKKRRGGDRDEETSTEHKETPSEDIEVGKFELERKNWKGAKSRFESALVLSPDDPEVYWGLAESARGLGQFAEARSYYKKLLDYDPDGPHGKAARKALSDPEIAHAQAAVDAVSSAPK
jgi:hypothetical protein